ncbi:hypothetical protein DB29_00630 [Shouchella clausii]|nr:hypothetical protein DB29_00630 [Shouchella clausii]
MNIGAIAEKMAKKWEQRSDLISTPILSFNACSLSCNARAQEVYTLEIMVSV